MQQMYWESFAVLRGADDQADQRLSASLTE